MPGPSETCILILGHTGSTVTNVMGPQPLIVPLARSALWRVLHAFSHSPVMLEPLDTPVERFSFWSLNTHMKGYDYEEFRDRFETRLRRAGGESTGFGGMVAGLVGKGRTICFLGGLHGDEPGGPLGVLDVLEDFSPECRVLFVPVVNRHGFENDTRKDKSGKDPNRQYCNGPGDPDLIRLLKRYRVEFLTTLHEDPSHEKFYLYYSHSRDRMLAESVVRTAKRYFPVMKSGKVFGDDVEDGLILSEPGSMRRRDRCTIEDYARRRLGCQFLTTEPPASAPVGLRTRFMADAIRLITRSKGNDSHEVRSSGVGGD